MRRGAIVKNSRVGLRPTTTLIGWAFLLTITDNIISGCLKKLGKTMRCCLFSILCLLFSQHIYAEQVFRLPEQCLLGSWQSDKEKTLEYNLPVWEWSAKYHK